MTPYPERATPPGFMGYDLKPGTVATPDNFPEDSKGPVRYVEIPDDDHIAGFLWSGSTGALSFETAIRARPSGLNLAVAINGEIRESFSKGAAPDDTFNRLKNEFAPRSMVRTASESGVVRELAFAANPVREVSLTDRIEGSLVGGAIGDALGYPLEFLSRDQIEQRLDERGLIRYLDGRGIISDDTQMTLFTAEGLIRGAARGTRTRDEVGRAYLDWFETQRSARPALSAQGLLAESWLYQRRAPGNTVMQALGQIAGTSRELADAQNNSKGCGTVIRSAPFGLISGWTTEQAFDEAYAASWLTHGHRTAAESSGLFAALIRSLLSGTPLNEAIRAALGILSGVARTSEARDAVARAVGLLGRMKPDAAAVESLGGGWVAEEALAIAIYCALSYPEPSEIGAALALAAVHSGDSDSTAALCGNILGALHGVEALPSELISLLEGRSTIVRLSRELAAL